MNKPYKICILGYGKLSEIAKKVVSTITYDDTQIVVRTCSIGTLPETVQLAVNEGCEVFIAGSSNAATFLNYSYRHLVELSISTADYLLAIKKAVKMGSERPAIVRYSISSPVDIDLIRELSGVPVELIQYEDSSELYDSVRNSGCDALIGASVAVEAAEDLSLKGVLAYAGEQTIKTAVARARNFAIEMRLEKRKSEVNHAIVKFSPFGIIVTDEQGFIRIFNRMARHLTNIGDARVIGEHLSSVVPALSARKFLSDGEHQSSRNHIINGSAVRCIQTRIEYGDNTYGVLTTLHTDNTRRRRAEEPGSSFVAKAKWKDIISSSVSMQDTITTAKMISSISQPVIIDGAVGTGKNLLAQCIHNGSVRSKEPYVVINTAGIAQQDAGRYLFGYEDEHSIRPGLLEMAGKGTVVLHGLNSSNEAVQSCLLQVLTEKSFRRVGGVTPLPFGAGFITIIADGESSRINRDLFYRLSTLRLSMPSLKERTEDIIPLFTMFLKQEAISLHSKPSSAFADTLRFYSWPGNVVELSSVAKRYAIYSKSLSKPNPAARHLMLIRAIGEEALLGQIFSKFPALRNISSALSEEALEGIELMKYILRYNDDTVATRLNISRTSLWRLKKSAEGRAEEREENGGKE